MSEPFYPPLTDDAIKAIILIAAVTAERGEGPSFRELVKALWPGEELTNNQRNDRIKALRPYGVMWRSGVPNSLNVPEEAVARALAAVRERRTVAA
jgi:hypothetical protein